jgi:hypothetical protein
MQHRSPTWRVLFGLALALSLAIGGIAAMSATAANNSSFADDATLHQLAPVSTVHTGGMRHGQDSGGDVAAQVLCLIACMGLTAAPSLPSPEIAIASPSYVAQAHIARRDAGDQALNRPTSPPPRAFATI